MAPQLRERFSIVLVVQYNDDRKQGKDQHVVLSLREDKSVDSECDETTSERARDRPRLRAVGEIVSHTVPNGKQQDPREEYESGRACLDQERKDIAVN